MKKTNEHLTDAQLSSLLALTLPASQLEEAAEHLACCTECASRLAALAEPCEREVTRGFASAVALEAERRSNEKKREFSVYCVRVAMTAAAAVAIVLTGVFTRLETLSAPELPFITQSESADIPAPKREEIPAPGEEKSLIQSVGEYLQKAAPSKTRSNDL